MDHVNGYFQCFLWKKMAAYSAHVCTSPPSPSFLQHTNLCAGEGAFESRVTRKDCGRSGLYLSITAVRKCIGREIIAALF